MAICENNCIFTKYDENIKKVECECQVKLEETATNQTNIFYHNFSSKDLSSNMISMKCTYILFTKDGILSNIANYLLIFFILFFTISSILFYKCGYHLLEDDIKGIIEEKEKNKKNLNIIETKYANNKEKKIKNKNKIRKAKNTKNLKTKIKGKKNKKKQKYTNINNKNVSLSLNINDGYKSFSKLKSKNKKNFIFTKKAKKRKKGIKKNIKKLIYAFELNIMSYNNAIKYDKRSYFSYYLSLIRSKHPIIFAFCPIKDYNSFIIKLDLFLLSFSILYFFNALFFDEKVIHKIYEDEGIYNFIYLIRFISYSFIISHTINIIIKYFSLSERNTYGIKNERISEKIYDKAYKTKKVLVIKYILFFILGLLFLLFLWYYLSSFGAVYKNTQVYLIKNTLISFGFSLIYPFAINLFIGIIRIYSLKKPIEK